MKEFEKDDAYMVLLRKDGTYETFLPSEDAKLCNIVNELADKSEAEIAIIPNSKVHTGSARRFLLYKDGKYKDVSDGWNGGWNIDSECQIIELEGCQVIMAWQYNIPIGTKVMSVPEDFKGTVVTRHFDKFGAMYLIKDEAGLLMQAYDAAIEILREAE